MTRRYQEKNKSETRDYFFNDYTRKIDRNKFFQDMLELVEKHCSLSEHDLIFVMNLVRHKILEKNKRCYNR